MALDKLTKVQSVGISSFIQVVGVVTATGGFVGDLTGNVTGNITGTTSNASGATGDFSIADKIVHTGDTNTALRFPAVDTFTVETGGSERFKVTDSLKEVKNGNLRITSTYIDFSGDISTPTTAAAIFRPADNTLAFSTGNNERLRIDSSGNIGIGTETIQANTNYNTLEIVGDAGTTGGGIVRLKTGNLAAKTMLFCDTGGFEARVETNHPFVISTNNTEKLRIASNGLVGIATAVPSYRLDIGDGATDPANGYQLRVNAAGDYIFALQRQSVPSFSIRNNSTGIVHLNTQNSKILSLGVSSGNASGSIEDDVRIDSNGHLTIVDGNLVVASGHGIDFSATGNGSGTMSSELLDDYEEGSWTPDLQFGGAKVGISYNNRWGRYTKVGNLITVIGRITLGSKGSSGGIARFFGLPYVTESITGTQMSIGSLWYSGFNLQGSIVQVVIRTDGNGNSFVEPKGVTANAEDAIGDSDFANNTDMVFTISYRTS